MPSPSDRAVEKGVCVLSVKQAQFGYDDIVAVWNVTFSVDAGKGLLIQGPNGAGKTTTLWGVAGLLTARTGSVEFLGEDFGDASPDTRVQRGLWFVQEGHKIFRRLTVEQNLKVMLRGAGYRRSELRQRVQDVYGVSPFLSDRRADAAGSLSGGQQQLLVLSAAVVIQPRLLLLDEPSGGLAPQAVMACVNLVREVKEGGAAIVVVEQRPEIVEDLCEQVLTMESGHVVAQT
jgi:branched-chain amino acid transport system ATP-binding protein